MLPLMPGSLEVKLPTYGQRKQQWWEESEKRERESEAKSQRREKQKREDQSARKGRKVGKHCVFPMFCGSGGSKSRLKRGCGAICSDERSKIATAVERNVQPSFSVASVMGSLPRQKWAKPDGFLAISKIMADVGRLNRICKDAFHRVGAVQETCPSDMFGGQGADFLRGVVFLEHQILRFAEVVLRDRCCTSHDLALLREMGWKKCTKALVRGWFCTRLSSAFHFWRKSRRIASFFDVVKNDASQNFIVLELWTSFFWRSIAVLDLSTSTFQGSLAEVLRFLSIATFDSHNCFISDRWIDR